MWTDAASYQMLADDVRAEVLVRSEAYTIEKTQLYQLPRLEYLANDTEVFGTNLNAVLLDRSHPWQH